MFGIHFNNIIKNKIKNELDSEIKNISQNGCRIIQIFANSTNKSKYLLLSECCLKYNIKIVCHISYSINCANNWSNNSWWLKQFINEIEFAHLINAFAVVVHFGKQLSLTNEEALNNMYQSMIYVHLQTKKLSNVKILFETSSGQGTEMCYNLNELASFYKKFSFHKSKEIVTRFGICLDTCHIFAAGYDIRNETKISKFISKFDNLIGLTNIKLIHLNDSKRELNEHIDRHENIGNGKIGLNGLKLIAKFFNSLSIPIILETPSSHIMKDIIILNKLLIQSI